MVMYSWLGEKRDSLPRDGAAVDGVFEVSELLRALREASFAQLHISIQHPDAPHPHCTKEEKDPLADLLMEEYHFYIFKLRDAEPSVTALRVAFGYSQTALLTKGAVLLLIFFLPVLLALWKRRKLARTQGLDEVALRGAAFRLVNLVAIGFPMVWWLSFSLTGSRELLIFFGIETGWLADLLLMLLGYLVPTTFCTLICKAILQKYLVAANEREKRWRLFVRELVVLLLGAQLPVLCMVSAILAFVGGNFRFGILYLAVGQIAKAVAKRAEAKSGVIAHPLIIRPLRERIFELASRAGVVLKEVYIVPEERDKTANACATIDNTVRLNEYLLRHFSRREVDAVVAHELGHLRLNHTMSINLALYGVLFSPLLLALLMSSAYRYTALLSPTVTRWMLEAMRSDLLFPVMMMLSLLIFLTLSRRFEFSADSFAVTVTGDPEAMISTLVKLSKLNLLPMSWSKFDENLLTHPSSLNRIAAIARRHHVPPSRVEEIINGLALEPEGYSLTDTQSGESMRPQSAAATTGTPSATPVTTPAPAPKRRLPFLLKSLEIAIIAIILAYVVASLTPSLADALQTAGISVHLFAPLVGIVSVLVFGYAVKRAVLKGMATKMEFYRTSADKYPALDRQALTAYTSELQALGFEPLIDYTVRTDKDGDFTNFARLFVQPQEKVFAEVQQVFSNGVAFIPMSVMLGSRFENEMVFSTMNRESDPILYASRRPENLFVYLPDAGVELLMQTHLVYRERIGAQIGTRVVEDTTLDGYLLATGKRAFKMNEVIERKTGLLYLLAIDYHQRHPKNAWLGAAAVEVKR